MGAELRESWTCRGCGVTARWIDGEAHPEPSRWREGACLKCQSEEATSADDADQFNGRPKRQKTGGRRKVEHPPLTDDQRARALDMMRAGESNTKVRESLGVHPSLVSALRKDEGIEHPNKIRQRLAAAAAGAA